MVNIQSKLRKSTLKVRAIENSRNSFLGGGKGVNVKLFFNVMTTGSAKKFCTRRIFSLLRMMLLLVSLLLLFFLPLLLELLLLLLMLVLLFYFIFVNLGLFFVHFCSFQKQNLQKKTVDFSGIQTRIVRVEGKQTDHLTTATAPIKML